MSHTWANVENKLSFWDHMYKSGHYQKTWNLESPSTELISLLIALQLPLNSRCLDVGCGAGFDLEYLLQQGFSVTGIDISPVAIDLIRARIKKRKVELLVGDILTTSFKEPFDFITDRGCFHHIANNKRPLYAQTISNALKSGGYLFLRGCRVSGGMWIPLILNELNLLFPSKHFKNLGFIPFKYEAPVSIPGAIALFRKI